MSNSTVEGYGGTGGRVQHKIDSPGDLPITGLDVGLLLAGGLLLALVGAALRKATSAKA